MIEVHNATVRFSEAVALSEVSVALASARTTALIGPSGCGKSTLLRVMLGLIEPDEGRVLFDGQTMGEGDWSSVRQRVGYAIQSGGLFPHMTCRQNVALAGTHAPIRRDAMRSRIDELAALMHLPDGALERYPAELSGGQRQRVALMRALVLDPEALLLDEPLGALDPVIRSELQRELRSLFSELSKTVVIVTHDLAEAAYLAPDDIVLMREGNIEQRGAFEELRSNPASSFVERFIASQTERVAALFGGDS